MPTDSPLTPELHDDLVAYLDGELDDASTQRIERTLSENAAVRGEVEALVQTFEMLDQLPRPQLSEDFTARTISSIRLSQQQPVEDDKPWTERIGKRTVVIGWIVGLVLSVLLGVLIGGFSGADDSERLVEDLPLLQNFDIYREVGEIEYLRKLEEHGVLNDNEQSGRP